MATQAAFDALFDPDFLTALERFRLHAKRVSPAGRHADQASSDRGAGLEFADYKPYVPGDDLRAIDWNVYRRLGRVFVRVFEERQDLPVYMLVDRSKSMFLERRRRIDAGLKAAFGLASIVLAQHDSVGLFAFSNTLEVKIKATSGRNRLMTFGRQLACLDEAHETCLADAVNRLAGMRLRRGLLVIVSDFFDPAGIEAVVAAMKLCRHRLLLLQLSKDADANPGVHKDLHGDVRLLDCESGAAVDVTIGPAVLARYQEIYQAFNDRLASFAQQHGAGLMRLNADGDVLEQLRALFVSGRLVV